MNTTKKCCATCRRWEADRPRRSGYGTCEMPDYYDEVYPPSTAVALRVDVDDDSGLSASLLTRPAFCCSEYSPKAN